MSDDLGKKDRAKKFFKKYRTQASLMFIPYYGSIAVWAWVAENVWVYLAGMVCIFVLFDEAIGHLRAHHGKSTHTFLGWVSKLYKKPE